MTEFQIGHLRYRPLVVDGTSYAQSVLPRRRDKAITDLVRVYRDRLSRQPDGCLVRVFPTDYTDELKRFSEEDHNLRRCIDILFSDGLNPKDMFLAGLVRQFSNHSRSDENDEDFEAELREIDCLVDDFEATLVPFLKSCIEKGTWNIIRYGFTPLGYKTIDDGQRFVPYVPSEFVIVRLQPSGEYICQGIDGNEDQGQFKLFFFDQLSDHERPTSDLTRLLPMFQKLQRAREVHDRSMVHASRPYIVTSQIPENKENDDVQEERREKQKAKLRERMLREQYIDGTSTAMRYVDMANIAATTSGVSGLGRAEELCGNGFMASAVRRTQQEMAEKLYTLKTKHHQDKEKFMKRVKTLEELLQMHLSGQMTDSVELPMRYQLPEGLSHVGSHLNVRPNALSYETLERLYHTQVEMCILSKQSSGHSSRADTRQGVSRSLVAEVDHQQNHSISPKSLRLQHFFVHVVLAEWLKSQKIPMTPNDPLQKNLGIENFHLMDRILCMPRMKLWLMCKTGYHAGDISMRYRKSDPYRTGQAIVVPQPVVPIATSRQMPKRTKYDHADSSDDNDNSDDDDDDDDDR